MAKQTPEQQLQDLIAKHGDDFDSVVPTLNRRPLLMQHVLALGWAAAVSSAQHNERRVLKATPLVETRLVQTRPDESPVRRSSAFARGIVEDARRRLLDDWKVNGKSLGDCTFTDLSVAAEQEDARAKGSLANRDFYRQLGDSIKGTRKTVRQLDTAVIDRARETNYGRAEKIAA